MKNELSETAVAAAINTKWLGCSYQYLESTGSTNDLLKKQVAAEGLAESPEGAVVLTDHQMKGRGRFDRIWTASPNSALLFSVLFRPNWPAVQLSWLSMLAGLSVAEAIEKETGLQAALKWPNDVVLEQNGIWSKVCGILLEGTISTEGGLEHAVLGIGINVNMTLDELPPVLPPAISLMAAAGHSFSRLALFGELLQRLETHYEAACRGESPRQAWNGRLVTLGQRVEVYFAGQSSMLEGTAEDTDEWGQLLVRDDQGQLHTVMAADVSLRGPAL